MGGVAVYVGAAFLIAIGGGVAAWPAKAAGLLTRDEDGKRLAVSAGAALRTRLAGLALVGLGAVLLWYGPGAFVGPPDVGAP